MTLILVPCAVCGSRDFDLLYRGAIDPDEDAARYFSSSRLSAAYPDIVRCKACGLVMANPRDDEETLARVYGAMTDDAYDDEDVNRSVAAAEHQRLLVSERGPPARVLDMGCASGFFVAKAHEAGFDVIGADASEWMIERARRRCGQARFAVGTVESLTFDAEFDVVTLWDVLEHVHSPRHVIERVRGWLKPGGLLLMSMPNSASLVARVLGPRWVLLLREHLWYFSPDTIARLLRDGGFEFVRAETKWVRFSLANVAVRLSQYGGALGSLSAVSGSAALKRASVRFPMGEMNVVARKL
jgi:2-polyprenyl-3-methyl-5-hydroxy-6-metoxy-1,4-benzoquinol methylase